MTPMLPDAEATLGALADRMRGGVAPDAAFVGIYSGGAWIAERLASMLGHGHRVGYLDVSFYRDDYERSGLKANAKRSALDFDVAGSTIVLIDDVLYTGRSVRAAINELFDYGRPAAVELAVLIDLVNYLLSKEAQAVTYDAGYFYPGPAVKDVPITMAPEESQKIIKEFGRDEYAAAIADNKQETPLPPDRMVYAFSRWDEQVGSQKKN